MTDRVHSLTITLEHDMKDDHCQDLILAIKQMRGVIQVVPCVADPVSHMAETRARWVLGARLREVLYGDSKSSV